MADTVDIKKSAFHRGEQLLQDRYASREALEQSGSRAIRPLLTASQREFFATLPYLVLVFGALVATSL